MPPLQPSQLHARLMDIKTNTIRLRVLYGLLILAIVTAGISPACAFTNGSAQNFIEICSGNNTKNIPNPNSSDNPEEQVNLNDSCPFCLNHFNVHALINEEVIITKQSLATTAPIYEADSHHSISLNNPNARAPPRPL